MALSCLLQERRISRFVDGELPLVEYRRVQEHLRVCARCHRRLTDFRDVDQALLALDEVGEPERAPMRLAVSVAVAAALLASLAANLFLPLLDRPREGAVLTVAEPPSQTLSSFYTRLADSGGPR